MMFRDQLSGYVHEVPEPYAGYGLGEVVYDGLGNPVGWNPFDSISRAVTGAGNLVSQAAQAPFNVVGQGINTAGQAIGSLFPGAPGAPGAAPPMPPGLPFPRLPFGPTTGGSMFPLPWMQNINRFARPPWPLGWQRAPLPYTGLGPRRLYMRCAVWPGPQGLVPGYAANMPPGMQPGMPGFPGPMGGGRRRHHRRR
jgi:hypothetical protein